MVFRGKPSRSCQRCRDRRLRCDLQRPNCSACLRARTQCTGYREIEALRFTDQTQIVTSKALSTPGTKSAASRKRPTAPFKLGHLPLDLQVQARELFLAYITDFSRAWDFLYPYFEPRNAPEHLSLSIDAVSLAFLSHQVSSPTARNLGRQKYVSALQKTNTILQSPKIARKKTTLEASLLLDLFEKMTNPVTGIEEADRAHVDGALALVKLRGLKEFRDSASLNTLTRLSLNATICCVSRHDPIPVEIYTIRDHVVQFVDVTDPKWRLNGIVLDMTNLVSELRKGRLTSQQRVQKCMELDKQLEELSMTCGPTWTYERRSVSASEQTDVTLDGFYDIYPDRKVTQMYNVTRQLRILLCEEIMEIYSTQSDEASPYPLQRATAGILSMVKEICASVPQMIDCEGVARHKLASTHPKSPASTHTHTLAHFLDAYILIFALYVGAWSRNCPNTAREWIISQLERIADHFGVREAALVVEVLKRQDGERVGPWDMYRLLGSYAFAA